MNRNKFMIHTWLVVAMLASVCLLVPASVHAAISQQERNALLDLFNGTNGSGWKSSTTSENISSISRDGGTHIVTLVFPGQTNWTTGYSIVVAGVQPASTTTDDFDGTYSILTASYDSGTGVTTLTYNQGTGNTGSGTPGIGTVTYSSGSSTGTVGWSGQAGTECGWYGVTCNSGQTSVTAINLSDNHLSGTIPSTLGNLSNLQELNLSGNQLSGPIPAALDNLTNLQHLDLSGNQLSGLIPSRVGLRANLLFLNLSANELSGSIPSSLDIFANLQELYLSANQLSGPIPSELGNLVSLQRLYLPANQLSGPLPSSLGSLTNLQELVLFGNQLSGPIPSSLGNLVNLQKLILFGNQLNGPLGSAFTYSIPPGGAYVFQTDASPSAANVGWVALTPSGGTLTPVGAGIFQFSKDGVLVTESGVPSAALTTHARIFVDASGNHDTGLALANPGNGPVSVGLTAFQQDGATKAGTSTGPVVLAPDGHMAAFVDQLVSGLPPGFQGVLDVASNSPFAALTLRSLVNGRGDFLLTTFPVADMTQPAPIPAIFPQIANGDGFTTEFILLSAGSSGAETVSFFGDQGTPLPLDLTH
ncbi:MAG TPA: leucine-rich repeat domain-containing protein [Acidobacteriota bacterium]|nr:leucine-rich repeat domain-containing protein [Acidobacteriota bacterium]